MKKEKRFTLRMDVKLYEKALKKAKSKFMSFNGYINSVIDADLYEYYEVEKNKKI